MDDADTYAEGTTEMNAQVRDLSARYSTPSFAFCPLIVQGHFRGGLCIHQTDRVRRWAADEIALVEAVAAQFAVGIAQAELFEMVARGKQTWEATFDAMSDGVFIFDNDRRLMRVNRAGAAMEELPPRELLGRRCCDILRAGEVRAASSSASPKRVAASRSNTRPNVWAEPLLVTAEPLRLGEPRSATVCTVRDLSELRQVERLARERQSLLENVLESARESICALDPEGRFMWCNSGATAMCGYAQEELIGQHFMRWLTRRTRSWRASVSRVRSAASRRRRSRASSGATARSAMPSPTPRRLSLTGARPACSPSRAT